jgi:hypothetical protein
MAEFVDTFSRIAMPEGMENLFLVSGGALAIENALKASFDWKVRKNFQKIGNMAEQTSPFVLNGLGSKGSTSRRLSTVALDILYL